jgi:hypothetical protein
MEDENNKITPPLVPTQPNTTLNENDTVYDLLPTIINKPPVIVRSISEGSTPQVRPSNTVKKIKEDFMYLFPDGTVKVHINATVTLRVDAEQPDEYNVENGELVIKEAQADLVYRWTKDGESIVADDEEPSLKSSRVLNGNTLSFNNIIPRYAGTYNCTVSNDIGFSDGGSITLEVLNSEADSSFYTNLVTNPNGTAEDGTISTQGWQSVSGDIVAKQLSQNTIPTKHKKIEVDPFNPEFEWTSDMLYPRPYQIDGGSLKKNPITNLNSYLTRGDYGYTLNGGKKLFYAYQDVDLTNTQPYIRGGVYGVEGVRAVISFYLGMAIYNYTPAYPYISPEARSKASTYFLGAPRLSLENFLKAGPGFVKEIASVEIEEYDLDERLQSTVLNKAPQTKPIKSVDPWNKRLPQYNKKVYYQGDKNLARPDQPSKGDRRDAHLFVADDLVPDAVDRFTYGQYAELNKIILDKLNPRTNKLRIVLAIEPKGSLGYILNDFNNKLQDGIGSGIFEAVGWERAYKSLSVESNNSLETETEWIGSILKDFRVGEPINQRVPKASKSKAFASGFNLALIPLEVGKKASATREATVLISKNNRVAPTISSPIDQSLTLDARDQGNRVLDISFEMNTLGSISITVFSSNPDIPEQDQAVLGYSKGLLPFDTIATLISSPTIKSNKDIKGTVLSSFIPTNGITSPTYFTPESKVKVLVDIKGVDRFTLNANDQKTPITYLDRSNFLQGNSPITKEPPIYVVPNHMLDNPLTGMSGYIPRHETVTQLVNTQGDSVTIYEDPDPKAPLFPQKWYSINDNDKLAIFNSSSLSVDYSKWSIPENPITLSNYVQGWNDTGFGNNDENTEFYIGPLKLKDYTWKDSSRFILTLGVHNTTLPTGSATSIHSTETYYLDFNSKNKAVMHKTPNIGGTAYLPGFSTEEEYYNNPYTFQNQITKEFESYSSNQIKTYTTDFLSKQKMDPVTMEVVGGLVTNTATIDIPQSILTGSRLQGGLNIPTIPDANSSGSMVADPAYKVIIYGIRPATAGELLLADNTLDNGTKIGTPLSGVDFDGKNYIVRTLSVTNLTDSELNADEPSGTTTEAEEEENEALRNRIIAEDSTENGNLDNATPTSDTEPTELGQV